MCRLRERFGSFIDNKWLVFAAAMWIESFAGIAYLFGSISPIIKSSLGYEQRRIASVGVAKDLGYSIGLHAAVLCEVLPMWAALLVGALQNFIGYGWLWLIVTGRAPVLPLWAICVLIFIGTNGETYFDTVALVTCFHNFPRNRGPVVGILKGFAGLGGAIFTQLYAIIKTHDHASLIFMIAVGPSLSIILLMFIVRPVRGHGVVLPSDGSSFNFIHIVCLALAAYLMGIMLVEDFINLSYTVTALFTIVLFLILLLPMVIPIALSFHSDHVSPIEERLLAEPKAQEPERLPHLIDGNEDEKSRELDFSTSKMQKPTARFHGRLLTTAAEGAVRIKWKRGPLIGEDFTLMQALINVDFWLLFFSLFFGTGSGLTVIDNLGQISQSLGYEDADIFVSLVSIWNFLGRIGGGYFSEIVVRDYAYPRPIALATAQLFMAIGLFFIAMGWPGEMYYGTLLIGLGYGAHWSIVPAAAAELFGLKNFAAIYNFIIMGNPAASLIFSGLIASVIYDHEAAKQAHLYQRQQGSVSATGGILGGIFGREEPLKCEGSVCFFLSSLIMSVFCIIAVGLSMILVVRTRIFYAQLQGKGLS